MYCNFIKHVSLLTIIFGNLCLYSLAQDNIAKWEDIYWVYRDMIKKDHMIEGDCEGCGIILKTRRREYFNLGDYDSYYDRYGGFKVADQPYELGTYLGILATEWYILAQNGQPTDEVETELFYALKTINRLDENAEYYWRKYFKMQSDPERKESDLNGFFIADDIFEDFMCYDCDLNSKGFENFMKLNSKYTKDTNSNIDMYGGMYSGFSTLPFNANNQEYTELPEYNKLGLLKTWEDNDDDYVFNGFSGCVSTLNSLRRAFHDENRMLFPGPREMSQDHCNWLMIGLVSVSHFVSSGVTGSGLLADGTTGSYDINAEAKAIINRIITWLYWPKGSDAFGDLVFNPNMSLTFGIDDLWIISNPITKRCVKGVDWHEVIASGDTYTPDSGIPLQCNHGGADAHAYSFGLKEILDMYTDEPTGYMLTTGKVAMYSTPLINQMEKAVQLTLTDMSSQYGWITYDGHQTVTEKSWSEQEFKYLDLLYAALHNEDPVKEDQDYYEYFNAVSCPQYVSAFEANEYAITDGLVYMFMHNLWKIVNNQPYMRNNLLENKTFPYYEPGKVIGAHHPFPDMWPPVTYNPNPIPVVIFAPREIYFDSELRSLVFNDLSVDIMFHADVTVRHKNGVKFGSNFKVEAGCYFKTVHGDIPMYCNELKSLAFDNNYFHPPSLYDKYDAENNEADLEDNDPENQNIFMYPNPSSGKFSILVKKMSGNISYEIVNSLGSVVFISLLVNSLTNIELDLSPGIYYVKFIVKDNVTTKKLIIER